jgi:NADH-quinone oxidoreductase subunit E
MSTCACPTQPAIATAAHRFQQVCAIIERHQRKPERLIPILQEVQEEYRYLPREVLSFVATALGLSPAKVFGVATFYAHFALEPKGRTVVRVCDGTACHVKDSMPIFDAIRGHLKLAAGQHTSADMEWTLEKVSCLGACGLAPVVVIGEQVHGQMVPGMVPALLDAVARPAAGSAA